LNSKNLNGKTKNKILIKGVKNSFKNLKFHPLTHASKHKHKICCAFRIMVADEN
jgi:uncharacterized protein YbbC (DUF1343 family)